MHTSIRACPRCSRPYSYIKERKVNGRTYLYAVHCYRDDLGRRKISECYLGPKDYYEYVTRMHEKEGLILKGLIEQERLLEYLDTIIEYITNKNIDKEQAKYILEKLEKATQKLKEILII